MGGKVQFIVTSTKPSKPVIVTEKTVFKLGTMTKAVDASVPRITYDELGGLKNEVQKIREMVELPMRHPELFEKIGVEAPKGVLLYGPPGTGKTLLQKQLQEKLMLILPHLVDLKLWVNIMEKVKKELEKSFKQAEENSPALSSLMKLILLLQNEMKYQVKLKKNSFSTFNIIGWNEKSEEKL